MCCHPSQLITRILRVGLKSSCRYRVVACGVDSNGTIINIKSNQPRLKTRGAHAEERVIFSSPKTLAKIIIARIGAKGQFLPIDPCDKCQELADKRQVKIERLFNLL